ncbi:MAG: hypothetical protein COT43_04470 [Candidatus Marinimicrobia bacterium CG08_land_8_20_14_0_20_45_22]|nr:MAG: hypothetical protein COT43_04470 [Candidatus Marinimicrobia bacterium CG08_land_8_20_14_0_20_45_22]
MFEHREADRIPITDSPWRTTIERWHREGLSPNQSWVDYCGIDHVERIRVDNSPRFPELVIEETEEYKIYTTKWGATQKEWKHVQSSSEFLDVTITDPEAITMEMQRLIPVLKESGGYIFSSDHSVPPSVSLADFRRIIALAKTLGTY